MYLVQKATPEHLDKLAPLFDAYRVFYKKDSDLQAAITFLEERLSKDESVVFMVYDGEKAVGFTQLYPLFSSVSMAPLWLLNDLFVDPAYRGQKIGKQLLEAAKDHCKVTNAKGVSLETEKTNLIGNQLYPKMGFVVDREHHFYFWENPIFSS